MNEKRELKLKEFQEKIGYKFRNLDLLDEALTHSSLKCKKFPSRSYERLEFIGDSVLDLIISKYIFLNYEYATQGTLTEKRKELVNNNFFRELAYKNKFHEYLDFEINDLTNFLAAARFEIVDFGRAPKVLADIFESVAGAIYVDSDSIEVVWHVYVPFFISFI